MKLSLVWCAFLVCHRELPFKNFVVISHKFLGRNAVPLLHTHRESVDVESKVPCGHAFKTPDSIAGFLPKTC
jgi:hypothetical protein